LLIKSAPLAGSLLIGGRIFLNGDMQRNFLSSRMITTGISDPGRISAT
jgi:hypothetical protein